MRKLIHEKGEISGLVRLVEVMDFNNRNYKLDPSWHDSIISVIIDVDGVNPNDNDIAEKIIKKRRYRCLPCKWTNNQTPLIVN